MHRADNLTPRCEPHPAPNQRIGTAGWSIPAAVRDRFGSAPNGLARYATRLDAVEINSSFYRPHRPATYARWAQSVLDDFRFAVKLPKSVTHERRLVDVGTAVDAFLAEVRCLGSKLGPVLVQLPPSLAFDQPVAQAFFALLRQRTDAQLACEPRHPGWFSPAADRLLADFRVARVAADPPPVPGADRPGGWPGLIYRRLHGSPRIYHSDYSADQIDALASADRGSAAQSWCIFDNTALGSATRNALDLVERASRG